MTNKQYVQKCGTIDLAILLCKIIVESKGKANVQTVMKWLKEEHKQVSEL